MTECLEYLCSFEVPDWAVSYLEYGDISDLSPEEVERCERFIATELPVAGHFELQWGEDIGFVRSHDLGGPAANCVELRLYVAIGRRPSDPTRAQMLRALVRAFSWLRDDQGDTGWKFDVEAAIYWFAYNWHSGQWSNLYSALSVSKYKPGALCRGVEFGSTQGDMYQYLVNTFCPRIPEGAK